MCDIMAVLRKFCICGFPDLGLVDLVFQLRGSVFLGSAPCRFGVPVMGFCSPWLSSWPCANYRDGEGQVTHCGQRAGLSVRGHYQPKVTSLGRSRGSPRTWLCPPSVPHALCPLVWRKNSSINLLPSTAATPICGPVPGCGVPAPARPSLQMGSPEGEAACLRAGTGLGRKQC